MAHRAAAACASLPKMTFELRLALNIASSAFVSSSFGTLETTDCCFARNIMTRPAATQDDFLEAGVSLRSVPSNMLMSFLMPPHLLIIALLPGPPRKVAFFRFEGASAAGALVSTAALFCSNAGSLKASSSNASSPSSSLPSSSARPLLFCAILARARAAHSGVPSVRSLSSAISGGMPPACAMASRFWATRAISAIAEAACCCASALPTPSSLTSGTMPPTFEIASDTCGLLSASRTIVRAASSAA